MESIIKIFDQKYYMFGLLFYFLIGVKILIITENVFSQPSIQWMKTFGGSNIDLGNDVKQTSGGGYIIAGYTRSYGTAAGRNAMIIKTDSYGNAIWIKGYGGDNDEEANGIIGTSDGGFVVAGYSNSGGAGLKDFYVLKVDSSGSEVWNTQFGGSNDEEAYSIELAHDGNFIVAGATSSFTNGGRDVYVAKISTDGNIVWTRNYGGLSTDGAYDIKRTSDNGFIITGWTASFGADILGNALLLKIDSAGNQLWYKHFGGNDVDRGLSVEETSDGGFIIAGNTSSFGSGLYDVYLIKTDGNGNLQWSKTFGGSGRDYGTSIKQTPDGNYIIAGYTLSYGAGNEDVWLIKTDSNGNKIWDLTLGGSAADVGNSVLIVPDGSYVVCGYTLSQGAGMHDVWLIKTQAEISQININLELLSGWNLLSIPIKLDSMIIHSIFPEATSYAYGYNDNYFIVDTAKLGTGFWLKFGNPLIKNLTGLPLDSIIINVKTGWNLIGPLHTNIPVESISTNPDGIISSYFYGYNNGYHIASVLEKGNGYWIKISSNGTMTIPSSSLFHKSISYDKNEIINKLINSAKIHFIESEKNQRILYLYKNTSGEIFELPPIPPAELFDVRFSDNTFLKSIDEKAYEVIIQGIKSELIIKTENLKYSLKVNDVLRNKFLGYVDENGLRIDGINFIRLRLEISEPVQEFIFYQNYPNPFNPKTNFMFLLPYDGFTTLKIYNILGEEVIYLINDYLEAGKFYEIEFDGSKLNSGIYFAKLSHAGKEKILKLILTK